MHEENDSEGHTKSGLRVNTLIDHKVNLEKQPRNVDEAEAAPISFMNPHPPKRRAFCLPDPAK
jgi:hypothetical protein